MNKAEKLICNFASSLANEHWGKLTEPTEGLTEEGFSEKQLKNKIKTQPDYAIWFLLEPMVWGMDKDYAEDYISESSDEHWIFTIDNQYVKFDVLEKTLEIVEKKIKIVEVPYFS